MAINSLSASSYGLSGLVSGMDTQSMVEKMLSGTKSKIVAQQQKKAQLEYKQELYRGLAAQLRALKSNYFDFASGSTTNLYSSAFFNSMTASTSSKYFTATATTSSSTGTNRIDYIKQLAKSATLQGKTKASGELKSEIRTGNTATGDLSELLKAYTNKHTGNLKFTVDDGTAIEVSLTSDDLQKLAGMSNSDAAQMLNTLFEQKAQAEGRSVADVIVKHSNGKMTFSSQNGGALSISGDEAGLALLGLKSTTVNTYGKLDTALNPNKLLPSVQVELDGGTAKTIYFDPTKYLNNSDPAQATNYAEAIQKSLQESLDTAFGHVIEVGLDKVAGTAGDGTDDTAQFSFNIAGNDPSRRFVIRGNQEAMNILGIKTGSSNKMTTGMYLDQINFAEPLEGNAYKFTINGVDFNVTGETTLSSLISQINNSDANVTLSYNPDTDKFSMSSKSAGAGSRIEMSQEQGNLLTALLGKDAISGNSEVMGNSLVINDRVTASNAKTEYERVSGGTIDLNITLADGRQRTITGLRIPAPSKEISETGYYEKRDDLLTAINKELSENEIAKEAGLKFKFDGDSYYIEADTDVRVEASSGGSSSLLTTLGFVNGQNNGATRQTAINDTSAAGSTGNRKNMVNIDLSALSVNGKTLASEGIAASSIQTVEQLEQAMEKLVKANGGNFQNAKVTFDVSEGAFHISNVVDADGHAVTDSLNINDGGSGLFANSTLDFEAHHMGQVVDGQDAILSYNGTEIRRSENTFTMNGVSYTLTGVYDGRTMDSQGNYKLTDGTVVDQAGFVLTNTGTADAPVYQRNQDLVKLIEGTTKDADGNITGYQWKDKDGNGVEGAGLDSGGYIVDVNGEQVLDTNGKAVRAVDANGYLIKSDGSLGDKVVAAPDDQYIYDDVAGETTVTRDTQKIYEGLMKFVDEYNKIMESIHSLLTEKPEYKDYAPLTDEQKAAMSDREVELWEEKSKTGLLRSDTYLSDIWDDLRSTLYKKPSGSSIALYDLGITTSANTDYGGQLVVDQTKLKAMLESNAEDIRDMFVNATDGLGKVMGDALNRAASSTVGSPGILTKVAGASKGSDTSSNLYKQLKSIDDNLDTLADRYDSEYARYWKQFNAMEQMIQQMNQQSSWLAQQFSS